MRGHRNARCDLSAGLIRSLFYYNRRTGIMRWKKTSSTRIKRGNIAGSITKAGHRRVNINGVGYLAHRLIWVWVTGKWPARELDHKNQKKADNRWTNIRPATTLQNNQNKGKRKNNTSGYKGVWFEKHLGKFRSAVGFRGKLYRCGCFKTAKAAHIAYRKLAKRLHKNFACFS